MSAAASPGGSWDLHGYVNTVQLSPPRASAGTILDKSTGISFVLFMVIGFAATLGFIGMVIAIYLIVRWCSQRRLDRFARDLEASAVIPEPKEMYLVVHPGGSADVAHKDLDDSPRKMVPRDTPIQLSAATLDFQPRDSHGIELYSKPRYSQREEKDSKRLKILNLRASTGQDTDRHQFNMAERICNVRLGSLDAADSPKILACHPLPIVASQIGQEQVMQAEGQRQGDEYVLEHRLSHRSIASDAYQDDATLLTPRHVPS